MPNYASLTANQSTEYIPLPPYLNKDHHKNATRKLLDALVCVGLCVAMIVAFRTLAQPITRASDVIVSQSIWKVPESVISKCQEPDVASRACENAPYVPKSKEPTEFEMRERTSSPWNESALESLRTRFHFQPKSHWMNDPDAPLFYQGWYHLFYQYNPAEAYWGLISWGHAVSSDLIHWLYLDLAMVPDHWYDLNGVWTGSATFLQSGIPAVIYTGSTNESVQVQIVAFPEDPSDPLLQNWTKIDQNPVLTPPSWINDTDFRDPTTAWLGSDGNWTLTIGSKIDGAGIALLYKSADFMNWELQSGLLHRLNGTGMWECVDFYPIAASGDPKGLDTSVVVGSGVKHVLKASMDETKLDFYTIGSYDPNAGVFTPDDSSLDLTYGYRYDYGRYYASKSFFDPAKQRRILFGWINESDTRQDDTLKGWACVQAIPRHVWFDNSTQQSLIQWPIEEVIGLRESNFTLQEVQLESEAIVEVKGAFGAQWDIVLTFQNPINELHRSGLLNHTYFDQDSTLKECSPNGAAQRGTFGPFGILVLSTEDLKEQTAIYFYLSIVPKPQLEGEKETSFSWTTLVCNDLSRSSLATNVDDRVYGGKVTILEEEDELSLRVIVDHSIIETFAQGGRTIATSRVYPTIALDNVAHLFLFNNGTVPIQLKHFEGWRLSSAYLHDFFDR